jgi:hypothetical protein
MSSPNDDAAANIARELLSWKSIEIRVQEQINQYAPVGPPGSRKVFDRIAAHYVENSDGHRYYDQVMYLQDKVAGRSTGFCDGEQCARVVYDNVDITKQRSLVITTAFLREGRGNLTDRPVPLVWFYLGNVPLNEALPKARYLGRTEVLGRPCERFLFSDVEGVAGKYQAVYTLDLKTSIPLKVESYSTLSALESGQADSRWSASAVVVNADRTAVFESERVLYGRPAANNAGELIAKYQYHVESISYDVTHPAAMFWPQARQPSAIFVDSIKKKVEIPRADLKTSFSVATEQPIKAETPGDASWSVSLLLVVMGILALLVGGILWRQQR